MKLYEVKLNWYGEVHTLWTQAESESKALKNAFTRFAKTIGVTTRAISMRSLKGNAFTVREVTKKED